MPLGENGSVIPRPKGKPPWVCKAPFYVENVRRCMQGSSIQRGETDMRIDEGQRLILAVFGMLSEEETDAVLDFIDQLLAARRDSRLVEALCATRPLGSFTACGLLSTSSPRSRPRP